MKHYIFLILCIVITSRGLATQRDKKKLFNACEAGDNQQIQKLLQRKPLLIHARESMKETPLHRAAKSNKNFTVAYLLECKADIGAKDECDDTPLHDASLGGHESAASTLLQYGADIHAKNKLGETPLHRALWCSKSNTIALLLLNNADVNEKNNNGLTSFQQYRVSNEVLDVSLVQQFIAVGVTCKNERKHQGICRVRDQNLSQEKTDPYNCIRCTQDASVENVQTLIFTISSLHTHTPLSKPLQEIVSEYCGKIYNREILVRLLQRREDTLHSAKRHKHNYDTRSQRSITRVLQ